MKTKLQILLICLFVYIGCDGKQCKSQRNRMKLTVLTVSFSWPIFRLQRGSNPNKFTLNNAQPLKPEKRTKSKIYFTVHNYVRQFTSKRVRFCSLPSRLNTFYVIVNGICIFRLCVKCFKNVEHNFMRLFYIYTFIVLVNTFRSRWQW